jgi:sarcosine oxidase gamma subunit
VSAGESSRWSRKSCALIALEDEQGFETVRRHLTVFGKCAEAGPRRLASTVAPHVGGSPLAAPPPDNLGRMNSHLLSAPGAVAAEGADAGVAAHYGDPFAEQRALSLGFGLVDRSHRGVVPIAGPDRRSWLHSLSTADIEHLQPGQAAEALILSPNGHVEHHLTLTDDGTALWAHVEPGTAEALLKFLESMRFMLRVEPADVSDEYAVLTVMGPKAASDARAVRQPP